MSISPTKKTESFGYFDTYINKVKEIELLSGLNETAAATHKLIGALPEEKLNYSYAPGKWTIKELMLHLVDTERVFAYRALRFARKDKTALPGFDQDLFAANSYAGERDITSILQEFHLVRQSTIALFTNFKPHALDETGVAFKTEITVRAAGYIILGHEVHHINVIKERYLNPNYELVK